MRQILVFLMLAALVACTATTENTTTGSYPPGCGAPIGHNSQQTIDTKGLAELIQTAVAAGTAIATGKPAKIPNAAAQAAAATATQPAFVSGKNTYYCADGRKCVEHVVKPNESRCVVIE